MDQRRRVRGVAAVLLSCAAVVSYAEEPAAQIKVLRSDEQSFVFEYTPIYSSPRTITEGGMDMMILDFPGSIPVHTDTTIGAPDLRYATFPLGFPTEAGNAVQVIAADYEDVTNVVIAPVPNYRVREEMEEVATYRVDPEKYSASAFLPARVAALSAVGSTRSMLLGSVQVFPLQYNPSTRTVRKYTRLVLEVVYGASKTNRVQNQDDLLFRDVLLNYNIARSWKFGSQPSLARAAIPSLLASGEWYRITVAEDGVYALSVQYLASLGINTAAIDPRTIKIYGNGGTEVPENIAAARPADLVENAIYVEGETDGGFNASDYVLFFGKSARGWRYNPSAGVLNHYLNHYSEVNYYWLTFGGNPGRRMQEQASLPDNPTVIPMKFLDGIAIEEETVNLFSSGKDWYGQSYSPGGSRTYVNFLPGLVPSDIITYRYSLVARSENLPRFTVRDNGQTLGTHGLPEISYISDYVYATAVTAQVTGTSTLPNNTSQLNFSFSSSSVAGTGYNDWIEIQYPRRFEAVGNYLRFRSPDVTGVVEYRLEQLASPIILNVSQFDNVRRVTGVVGSYTFRAAETAGQMAEYCAAGSNAFKLPAGITRVDNQDLHGISSGYDFIILTTPEFRAPAERLRAYREQPAHGNLRTIVVDVNQIYNEFGGGIPDVAAVRDFLKYAYDTWTPRPLFVLMLGQGSFDYKGRLGGRSSYVPTWQSLESRHGTESYSTDDFFVKFDLFGSNNTSMVTGRIPSRTVAEAEAYIGRLVGYEENSARDPWKMRMLYIGDDGLTTEGDDGVLHSQDAEILAEAFYAQGRKYTPEVFERKKIYIAEYPTVNTSQGRRKPGAYQAIIDEINRGVLIVNYAGHGNPTLLAHENIFNVQTSIPQLTNANKLSLFILATCNFSQFDDPARPTGSEILINRQGGGAIGVISATRKVFAGQNAYFHQQIFRRLFVIDAFGRVVVERPATTIFLFKASSSNSVNDQKYFYMGDPTMRLQYPSGYASIDSINEQRVDSTMDTTGTLIARPVSLPIEIKALARITVKGTIRDQNNLPDSSFQGSLLLTINDATRGATIANFPTGCTSNCWTYTLTGGTIYRGDNSVRNGRFSATFVVPKDIAYADSSTRGRLVTYFTGASSDGAGYTGKIRVGGTETAALDTTAPTMNVYLDSRSFRSGDMVSEDPVLYVDLVDSNGINTSVSGIGHRIEAWVNNSPQSKDVTEFYSSKLDNYQEGTVQYPLTGLPLGRNVVRVRAWDTHNNAAAGEAVFEVASSQQLRISDVMNYPNPFAGGTSFTFKQNQLSSLTVVVKVYTLAGRLIQSLEAVTIGDPFIRIPWDGRDRDGDVLANGVYLYKVIVRTTDGRFSSEAIGKLSVVK